MEPQWIPSGTCGSGGPVAQQNSEMKSPNNTQGHWGQRGCLRHLPASRSLAPARSLLDIPAKRGKPVLWHLCRVWWGQSFFGTIRCCFTIYLPCILVEPKFAVLLSWFPFHLGDENQTPDGKNPVLHRSWKFLPVWKEGGRRSCRVPQGPLQQAGVETQEWVIGCGEIQSQPSLSAPNYPWDQTFLRCRSNSWPDHTIIHLNKN